MAAQAGPGAGPGRSLKRLGPAGSLPVQLVPSAVVPPLKLAGISNYASSSSGHVAPSGAGAGAPAGNTVSAAAVVAGGSSGNGQVHVSTQRRRSSVGKRTLPTGSIAAVVGSRDAAYAVLAGQGQQASQPGSHVVLVEAPVEKVRSGEMLEAALVVGVLYRSMVRWLAWPQRVQFIVMAPAEDGGPDVLRTPFKVWSALHRAQASFLPRLLPIAAQLATDRNFLEQDDSHMQIADVLTVRGYAFAFHGEGIVLMYNDEPPRPPWWSRLLCGRVQPAYALQPTFIHVGMNIVDNQLQVGGALPPAQVAKLKAKTEEYQNTQHLLPFLLEYVRSRGHAAIEDIQIGSMVNVHVHSSGDGTQESKTTAPGLNIGEVLEYLHQHPDSVGEWSTPQHVAQLMAHLERNNVDSETATLLRMVAEAVPTMISEQLIGRLSTAPAPVFQAVKELCMNQRFLLSFVAGGGLVAMQHHVLLASGSSSDQGSARAESVNIRTTVDPMVASIEQRMHSWTQWYTSSRQWHYEPYDDATEARAHLIFSSYTAHEYFVTLMYHMLCAVELAILVNGKAAGSTAEADISAALQSCCAAFSTPLDLAVVTARQLLSQVPVQAIAQLAVLFAGCDVPRKLLVPKIAQLVTVLQVNQLLAEVPPRFLVPYGAGEQLHPNWIGACEPTGKLFHRASNDAVRVLQALVDGTVGGLDADSLLQEQVLLTRLAIWVSQWASAAVGDSGLTGSSAAISQTSASGAADGSSLGVILPQPPTSDSTMLQSPSRRKGALPPLQVPSSTKKAAPAVPPLQIPGRISSQSRGPATLTIPSSRTRRRSLLAQLTGRSGTPSHIAVPVPAQALKDVTSARGDRGGNNLRMAATPTNMQSIRTFTHESTDRRPVTELAMYARQMGSLFALTEVPIVRRILEAPSSTVPGSCQVSARTFSRDTDTISRPLTTSSTRIHTGTSDTSRSQFSAFRLLAAVRAVTDALSSMNKGDPALTADVALAILNSAGSPAMTHFLKDLMVSSIWWEDSRSHALLVLDAIAPMVLRQYILPSLGTPWYIDWLRAQLDKAARERSTYWMTILNTLPYFARSADQYEVVLGPDMILPQFKTGILRLCAAVDRRELLTVDDSAHVVERLGRFLSWCRVPSVAFATLDICGEPLKHLLYSCSTILVSSDSDASDPVIAGCIAMVHSFVRLIHTLCDLILTGFDPTSERWTGTGMSADGLKCLLQLATLPSLLEFIASRPVGSPAAGQRTVVQPQAVDVWAHLRCSLRVLIALCKVQAVVSPKPNAIADSVAVWTTVTNLCGKMSDGYRPSLTHAQASSELFRLQTEVAILRFCPSSVLQPAWRTWVTVGNVSSHVQSLYGHYFRHVGRAVAPAAAIELLIAYVRWFEAVVERHISPRATDSILTLLEQLGLVAFLEGELRMDWAGVGAPLSGRANVSPAISVREPQEVAVTQEPEVVASSGPIRVVMLGATSPNESSARSDESSGSDSESEQQEPAAPAAVPGVNVSANSLQQDEREDAESPRSRNSAASHEGDEDTDSDGSEIGAFWGDGYEPVRTRPGTVPNLPFALTAVIDPTRLLAMSTATAAPAAPVVEVSGAPAVAAPAPQPESLPATEPVVDKPADVLSDTSDLSPRSDVSSDGSEIGAFWGEGYTPTVDRRVPFLGLSLAGNIDPSRLMQWDSTVAVSTAATLTVATSELAPISLEGSAAAAVQVLSPLGTSAGFVEMGASRALDAIPDDSDEDRSEMSPGSPQSESLSSTPPRVVALAENIVPDDGVLGSVAAAGTVAATETEDTSAVYSPGFGTSTPTSGARQATTAADTPTMAVAVVEASTPAPLSVSQSLRGIGIGAVPTNTGRKPPPHPLQPSGSSRTSTSVSGERKLLSQLSRMSWQRQRAAANDSGSDEDANDDESSDSESDGSYSSEDEKKPTVPSLVTRSWSSTFVLTPVGALMHQGPTSGLASAPVTSRAALDEALAIAPSRGRVSIPLYISSDLHLRVLMLLFSLVLEPHGGTFRPQYASPFPLEEGRDTNMPRQLTRLSREPRWSMASSADEGEDETGREVDADVSQEFKATTAAIHIGRSYPVNVLFTLQQHLNHPINRPLQDPLRRMCSKRGIGHVRLIKLLAEELFRADQVVQNVAGGGALLGHGAFGDIFEFEATDEFADAVGMTVRRSLAVKLLRVPDSAHGRCVLATLFTEVAIMEACVDEGGVVRLYEFGVSGKGYWLIMERCACNLRSWRSAQGEPPRTTSLGALQQLLLYLQIYRRIVDAVARLHELGITHFDLKCDNVLLRHMLQADSTLEDIHSAVAVSDFGEAAFTPGENANNIFITDSRGTDCIKSPEMLKLGGASQQARAHSEQDRLRPSGSSASSDVWSLGCLLFELVAGRPLFDAENFGHFFARLTSSAFSLLLESDLVDLGMAAVYIEPLLHFILVRNATHRPVLKAVQHHVDSTIHRVSAAIQALQGGGQ